MKLNFNNSFQRNFLSDASSNGIVQTGLNAVLPGSGAVLGFLSGIFGNKPDPNDWQGWDALDRSIGAPPGDSPTYWVLNDGDSVENEAANIVSYIKNNTNGLQNMLNSNWGRTKSPNLLLQLLYDKLQRGGYANAATQIQQSLAPKPVNNNVGNASSAFEAQNAANAANAGNNFLPNTPGPTQPENKEDKKVPAWYYIAITVVAVGVLVVAFSFMKNKGGK